ncbi:hypothetical protein BDR22DRAFT_851082 [Usnea florida]
MGLAGLFLCILFLCILFLCILFLCILFLCIGLLLGLPSLPFLPFSLPSQSFFLPYNLPSLLSISSSLLFSLLSGSLFLCLPFSLHLRKGDPLCRLLPATTRTRLICSSDDVCSSLADRSSMCLSTGMGLSLSAVSLGIGRVLSGTGHGDSA